MAREFVTVITDASYCEERKRSFDKAYDRDRSWGWAGAVIHDRGRQFYHAPGKSREVLSSNDAEMGAVTNTVVCMVRDRSVWQPGEGWLLQLDNLHVINLLNYHWQDSANPSKPRSCNSISPFQRQCLGILGNLIAVQGPKFVLARHIKAHVSQEKRAANPRNYVQEQVDRLAVKAARAFA